MPTSTSFSASVSAVACETPASHETVITRPIEEIALGARVPGRNPQPADTEPPWSELDSRLYCVIELTVRHADGMVVDIELLRPRAWVAAHALAEGKIISVSFPEMDLQATAVVRGVHAAPNLQAGAGSLVTGRFVTRHAVQLVEALFADGTSLRGTSRHPIWSEEAGDWVGLGELQRGEVVRTAEGTVAVASVKSCPEGACVYNIETQGEHVYHVGAAGVLVHNNDELCSRITELMSKVDKLNAAERAELSRLMDAQDAAAGAAKTTGKAADVDVNSTKAGKGDTVDGEGVVAPGSGKYRGGSHAAMSGTRTRGDGLDSHHMPDRSADPTVNAADGPAIQMDPLDHRATSSWGSSRDAGRYRAETAEMIRQGRYRDAMAREIRDVRRAAQEISGNTRKYNEAIREMLEYARGSGQLPGR